MRALVIRPLFDDVTAFSHEWASEVIKLLESYSYGIFDLDGENAIKEVVEEVVIEYNPELVIFYDHGNTGGLVGQDRRYVFDESNYRLLKNKEVFTMACLWLKKGGIDAYKTGAKAVWGYTEEFVFTTDAPDVFMEYANSGLRFKLEGRSWSECLEKVKELGHNLARSLAESGKYMASAAMEHNIKATHCWNGEKPTDFIVCPFRRLAVRLFGKRALGWLKRVEPVKP